VGAEGLRADLTICRASAALAGWEGRDEATVEDVRRVAPLALAHRRRRSPLEDGGISPEEVSEALDEPDDAGDSAGERTAEPDSPSAVVPLAARQAPLAAPTPGRRTTVAGPRGRLVGDRPVDGPVQSIAVSATVRAVAARGGQAVEPSDLREAIREQRTSNLIVLVVDASGSMGASRRMEAAKGAVLSLLLDAYQRRDLVALVTFRGDDAQVVLRPTGSVEVARARLDELPTGGRTPLAAGLVAALELARTPGRAETHRPLLVLLTDGRATAAPDGVNPVDAARTAADAVRRAAVSAVVVDAEDGPMRLGLARQLAGAMGGRYLTLPELSAGALDGAIRSRLPSVGP
jgi:magnesium chelatase subunit D